MSHDIKDWFIIRRSDTFGDISRHTTSDMKQTLSLCKLPQDGTKQVVYERVLGAHLYYEEQKALLRSENNAPTSDINNNESTSLIPSENQSSTDNIRSVNSSKDANAEDNNNNNNNNNNDNNLPQEWVECDKCSKWRSLPRNMNPDSLPDAWECSMNTWDEQYNNCNKDEEPQPDDDDDDDDGDDDEEYEEWKDPEYQRRILTDFKEFLKELKVKKRKREDDAKQRKEETTLRKQKKVEEELKLYISSLTQQEISAGIKRALKKNAKQQIPMHWYPQKYADAKATTLLRQDLALLRTSPEYDTIEKIADVVNAQDKYGRTPVHYAVLNEDHEQYREELMKAGGSMYCCDDYEKCPEEYMPLFKDKKTWIDKFI